MSQPDEAFLLLVDRVSICIRAIKARHGATIVSASMPCPTGCGGKLYYAIPESNGHTHGECTTVGCAKWAE